MEQNHNMLRGISENGGIVFYGVDSTEIVREMERLHKTSAVTTAALGRLLTAASMMGIMLKSTQDSVTLQIKGGGPAGRLLAVSDGTGNVKGYVEHPVVELPPRADGHLNVGAAVGKDGTLDVIRDLGMREPYIGQVPLTSGEIAEDITTYFAISEQVPTVCALGVLVDKDLSVRCAGGFVVQLLPGATEEEIEHLEKNIKAMPSVTTMLEEGKSVRDMLELALAGFAPDILDSYHVTYKCDCGLERVEKMIRSLGKKEVERMRDEDPVAEVNCQFCNKHYEFSVDELKKLRHIGAMLQGHPDMKGIPGIDMSSGSLGQGISAAAGMALAGKIDNKDYRVYSLLGDGEIEEGQVWEAAMFAGFRKLDNLVVIVDNNGLQIDGKVDEVCSPYPIDKKFEAFNFHVINVADGNDMDQLRAAFDEAKATKGMPTAIIMKTVKGKGVSFMENQVGWHGKAPNDEQYAQAMEELEKAGEALCQK